MAMRSTPVGNLLHSPELKDSRDSYYTNSLKSDYAGYARDNYHHQPLPPPQQHHYLNVGRSPVNSVGGDNHQQQEQLNEADEEQPQYLQNHCSPSSQSQSHHVAAVAPELPLRSTKQESSSSSVEKTPHDPSMKSSSHFASKKRNRSVAVVSEGEVVIFDDIEGSWYNLKTKPESIGEGHVYKQNFIADPDSVSPERNSLGDTGDDTNLEQQTTTAGSSPGSAARGAANGSSVAGMVIGKL